MSETPTPATFDASSLRRIRSMGDISRPQRVHVPNRRSESRAQQRSGQTSPTAAQFTTSPLGTISDTAATNVASTTAPTPTLPTPTSNRPSQNQNLSRTARFLAHFGLGRGASRARRSLVALIFNLVWGFVQIVVISTVLGLSGTTFKSPTIDGLTEWEACDKPLGIWAALWVVREVLSTGMTYWDYVRARQMQAATADTEGGGNGTAPQSSAVGGNGPRRHSRTSTGASGTTANSGDGSGNNNTTHPPIKLPYTELYTRLTFLSTLMMLIWFLVAHILEYTSIQTCRLSSPHIWWLNFGILSIMYFMVLEVLILGIIVFIIAPIIFLIWNITLILLGRHPLQNPGMIKPEIGKLSKSVVEKIPLVIYIPPPPENLKDTITIPPTTYSYPPKPFTSTPPASRHRSRFRFLRRMRRPKQGNTGAGLKEGEKAGEHTPDPLNWEDHWEHVDYPFVVLEGNRAACAICLMDFEEPKRVIASQDPSMPAAENPAANAQVTPSATSPAPEAVQVIPVEPIAEEDREDLRLEDAGEGAQPLRLLACGHVFHVRTIAIDFEIHQLSLPRYRKHALIHG
ncbi:hypothetical protein AX16_002042 [Volvariella volvacea WC 439]|nr:hypothetical protein AX16_002042 [Volvariella volvacea WC 439]